MVTTKKSLEERIRALEDKDAVMKTKARYLTGCDTSNWDMVMSTFAKECTADLRPFGLCVNREGVNYFFTKHIPSVLPFMMHRITNVVIDVTDETHAKLNCYFDVPCTHKETNQAVTITGIYNDDFVKENGEWLIKSLNCTFVYITPYDKGWAKEKAYFKGEGPTFPPKK